MFKIWQIQGAKGFGPEAYQVYGEGPNPAGNAVGANFKHAL